MEQKIHMGRHESFPLREGWAPKALDAVQQYGSDTFHKVKGIEILGIGSNMVTSLRYWMRAGNILDKSKTVQLSNFGKVLVEFDPFMELRLSWLLYHYYLCQEMDGTPLFYFAFKCFDQNRFEKEAFRTAAENYYKKLGTEFNQKSFDKEVSVFLATYVNSNINETPEENKISPLVRLNLIQKLDSNLYEFSRSPYESGMYLLVFYLLEQQYGDDFDLNKAFEDAQSPVKTFNISKADFQKYLSEMNQAGLIAIENTAGLSAAYLRQHLTLEDVYRTWEKEGGR